MKLGSDNMKLFYPEPIFDLKQITTSTFLYFQQNLATTLHPTVSLFTTGCDPYKFLELLDNSNYDYKAKFYTIFNWMEGSTHSIHQTADLLKPLYENGYAKSIWLAYPRNDFAFEKSEEIISKTGLSKEELLKIIDPIMASQELMSHILFEKFLELYQDKLDNDIRNQEGKTYEESRAQNIDYKDLLTYCDALFSENSIEDLLIKSYFFRFQAFQYFPDILITNEKLLRFLEHLKVDDKAKANETYYGNLDIISWEIFRQLTSKYLEEKEPSNQINQIVELRKNSADEIESLKIKCLKLAEQFKGDKSSISLKENISQHIKIHTTKEISDLLKLDKKITGNVMDAIFSDEKTWLAFGAFLTSLLTGGPLLTAGTALATISNIAAKTYKQVAEAEKKINESEYALIYRLKS